MTKMGNLSKRSMASDTDGMAKKRFWIPFACFCGFGLLLSLLSFLILFFREEKDASFIVLLASLLGTLILSLLASFLSYYFLRKEEKRRLLSLRKECPNDFLGGEETDLLLATKKVLSSYQELLGKMMEEKKKDDFLISHMRQGYLLFDNNYKVKDANEIALGYLKKTKEETLGKDFPSLNLGDEPNRSYRALFQGDLKSFDVPVGEKTYLFIPTANDTKAESYRFAFFILDVSENRLAAKIRKEFFQNASHELKSPLTSIIGYQELIQNGIVNDREGLLKANEVTLQSALHMKAIVEGMFTLFGIESNLPQKKEEVDVLAMVESMLLTFKPQIEKKRLKLLKDTKPTLLKGSAKDLSMIFENLISNAIKYNKEGGLLEIHLDEKGFSIRDTGVGIDKKDLPRIFERFYIADRSRSRSNDSTGLGLAIVKHLCLNNGYRVKVNSELGKGSTFEIFF